MNKSKLIVVLALCVIIAAIVVGFIVASGKAKIVSPPTKQIISTPTFAPTSIPTVAATIAPTRYPAETRAKVRAEFISRCMGQLGGSSKDQCNCAADWLTAHYSDSQLAIMYIEFHSNSTVPPAIQTAADACKPKK